MITLLKKWGLDSRDYLTIEKAKSVLLMISLAVISIYSICFTSLVQLKSLNAGSTYLYQMPQSVFCFLLLTSAILAFGFGFYKKNKSGSGNLALVTVAFTLCASLLMALFLNVVLEIFISKALSGYISLSHSNAFLARIKDHSLNYYIAVFIIIIAVIVRASQVSYRLNVHRKTSDTSRNLGKAKLASSQELTDYGFRNDSGILIGKDDKGLLRYPKLTDMAIIAYRGGGKTSGVLIPGIIDYQDINKLITDIKGELVAVTAKKAMDAGRKVYVLDPFGVCKALSVNIETHSFNPIAYIDETSVLSRDRYISAIVSAICNNERPVTSNSSLHFDESAQIILEGLLDYYLLSGQEPNLVAFHDFYLDFLQQKTVPEQMITASKKSHAAYSILTVAGKDEVGSMKTTIYRQLQWLRSDNVRNSFQKDELNIDNFVKGDADIYVVLPEDMVKAHSRMVRVVMGVVKAKIISEQVHNLKSDYLFVLDELGQFGYCKDVEQVVATLRGRGVKVWASFQTIDQIEKYEDKATFKGMPIKQFLGSDDIPTLEWIQKLAGKTTVLSENISKNTSNNTNKLGNHLSNSISISENACDLIHFNEIREKDDCDKLVFIHGHKVIWCQKSPYFIEPSYKDLFDENPIENLK